MGADVTLGRPEDGEPVLLRYDHRTAHVAILGKSGFGKTTLLEHLVLSDMRDNTAVIVIDAHGDLTRRLVSLAPSDARDKIVLVEPNDERPFGLNLYARPDPTDMRSPETAVDHIMEIFNKLMGAEAGYRSIIDPGLRNTARLLIANDLTMAELPLLYSDEAFRRSALSRVANRYVHDYWRDYDQSPPREQQQRRDSILNKVGRFLEDDLTLLMVAQPTTIPIKQVMDEGGILLFNLAGLGRTTTSLLGMVLLATIERLFHERERLPAKQRKRVHLYLDEYGRFETPTTRQMLAECRKYGLGATIAHQKLAQTPEREALDVQTLISFQLGAEDAYAVAGSFDCTPIRTKRVARQRTEPDYWSKDHGGEVSVTNRFGRTIYDNIEEINQTHADRQAEIANMLTQLPRYVAYCKVFDGDGKSQEHRIDTLPPAKPKTLFDDQLDRAVRIAKKVRGSGEIKLERFGSMSPEVGFTFKQKEFQETIAGLMQDIRYDVRSYGKEPSSEHRVEEVRARSREQFGTPRSEVEEQIRKRPMRPPPDDGQPARSTPQPKGPPPPASPPPGSAIGRRSPKG